MVGWLTSVGLNVACPPVVREVVDLAVEGGDLAVSWAAALSSGFGGAQELLVLEEPLEVGAAAAV
jgi:hypothetical protein